MADFIALDWEKRRLNGLEAALSRGRVRVRRCFQLAWPATEADAAAEPAQTGQWLKGELARLGIGARAVLVSLPREEVVVRQIEVPDVPDEELPELVRLQAETRISTSIDKLVLDFLPLPRIAGEAARAVLLFTISRDKLSRIQQVVEAAGLELEQIGVSSAATVELVARIEDLQKVDADETTLTVARHGKRVEISLMRQRHLLFTHSAQLTGDDDQQDSRLAAAEIRRALGAHSRIEAGVTVARAWALGTDDENQMFRQTIAEQLTCEAGSIDPLANPLVAYDQAEGPGLDGFPDVIESHAPYGGPLGMLLAVGQPLVAAVDFLHPRRAVVRRDNKRLKQGLIAAALVLSIAVAWGVTRWRVSALESEAAEKTAEFERFTETLSKGKPTLDAAAVIRDWQNHNLDWLDRMGALNEVLPGTDRVYLANYRFTTPSQPRWAGHVHADGFARSRGDVNDLNQRLSEHGYSVQPQAIPPSSKDPQYPYSFQLELDVPMKDER